MGTEHLNIFFPYKNKPLNHEDQLTRAFLILVRSIKIIEATFLDLLATGMKRSGIEIVPVALSEGIGGLESIETQVSSSTKARLASESGRLVSVIITDKKLDTQHRVKRTGRVAVYDGFLRFKPDWVFVIENKPDHTNIWPEQLSSAFNENYEVEPIPVVLTWQEIITRVSLLKENGLVQDAGFLLVENFMEFVQKMFPELNPYDRFQVCKGDEYLLEQRCVAIMNQTKLGSVDYHRGWHYFIRLENKPGIKQVAFYPEMRENNGWEIILALHPGDTMSQAREMYESIQVDKLEELKKHGWKVSPNFHLAYRSSGLYRMDKHEHISLEKYVKYWKEAVHKDKLQQIPRNDWNKWFSLWKADGLMTTSDIERIQEYIVSKSYPNLNVCPGLHIFYTWDSNLAIEIDNQGDTSFAEQIKAKVAEVTSAW